MDEAEPLSAETTERLDVPEAATPREAAAIAAAIEAYLSEEAAAVAAEDAGGAESWEGARWRFAGRLEVLGGGSGRVPADAPRDPWRAAERVDRF